MPVAKKAKPMRPDFTKLAPDFRFAHGSHVRRGAELCLMEAVAWVAGEEHSDTPACVSGVISAALRSWNDSLSDPPRTELLKPLIPHIIGTATTQADEETRAWMATDWLVRVHTPAWLRLAGLTTEAQDLEALARIVDAVTASSAQPTIALARSASAAARDAARDAAAWAAARDAAWAAASAAARDAAWAAASAAARAAASDAARDAARAAASDAARDAAWAAASDAARDAAWAAARAAASDAARDAAEQSLAPTVIALQASFEKLILAMCAVGRSGVEG